MNLWRETNVAKWDSEYDFPAVQEGDVTLSVIPHSRPSGMTGLVMNTRSGDVDPGLLLWLAGRPGMTLADPSRWYLLARGPTSLAPISAKTPAAT